MCQHPLSGNNREGRGEGDGQDDSVSYNMHGGWSKQQEVNKQSQGSSQHQVASANTSPYQPLLCLL